MTRTIEMTEEQKQLFRNALEAVNQAGVQAQMQIDFANVRRKSLDDLLTLFCLCNGLHKERVKLDPVAGIVTEEVDDVIMKL